MCGPSACACKSPSASAPALFNLAIDSKLRACDLVKLHVRDICHGAQLLHRATIMGRYLGIDVDDALEISEQTEI